MSVEYLPVGIACNIKCGYCYQDPMREAGNINVARDWAEVKKQLERLGQNFAVFGGEPLLAPIDHLEEVWKFGLEKFGSNGIQTNGSLITDKHIELFLKYKVQVGISIDGPGEMNSVRCNDELTLNTEVAIKKLCNVGIFPSIICTIHNGNNDLPALCNWFDSLSRSGIRYLNLHEMEVDCGRYNLALSEERQIETYLELYEWSKATTLQVLPFADIKKLLTEMNPSVMCVWNHCDPQTTAAVQGVSPDGVMSNCGRTNKDGVNWVKADTPGTERYIALYNTPQESGGCRDCRYFAFCNGHCPGTAIDGDWRNRTVNCKLWYSLFQRAEDDLLSQGFAILNDLEKEKIIKRLLAVHPVNSHGDVPHGDEHGDHYRLRYTSYNSKGDSRVGEIKKLDFSIPEFLRTVWASETARQYWQPKIHVISNLWKGVELLTLREGYRQGVLQSIDPIDLTGRQEWSFEHDVPMAIVGIERASGSYANASTSHTYGEPFTYRVYFGAKPKEFLESWKGQDDLAVGEVLGFPRCCTEFFVNYWKLQGWRDYTVHTIRTTNEKNLVYNNVLLRHIGIRGVFHLPCSPDCEASVQVGKIISELMQNNGFSKEADWLRELLSMPMQWTSLHGIAMVVTPILKTIYASDALGYKATLNLHSSDYPKYGVSGNQFPFVTVRPVHIRQNLNGFNSLSAMHNAHNFIVAALPEKLSGKILDLGCGNGQLLKTIQAEHPNTELYGVEVETVKNRPFYGIDFWYGNIFDYQGWQKTTLTLIAIQRLTEVSWPTAHDLLEVIKDNSEYLLLYSYGGWSIAMENGIKKQFDVVSISEDSNANLKAILLKGKSNE